jgi:ribosomal protein L7/L12
MRPDQIRSETARRLAGTGASLPSSLLGRQTWLFAGLGQAGARSLGRAVSRRLGRGRADQVEPEIAAAATMGRLKGVTMKMAQLAGYLELGLPGPLGAALSALHTHAQPLAFDRVRRVVEAELGAAGAALARTLEPTPLSAASVGQVHRGALPDGTAVAVKVQHPGLDAIIARELAPATLASRLAAWVTRRAQLRRLVDEVRARLVDECDYVLEARRQARFAALFAGHPTIVVPAVHAALSSGRVLTTTLERGVGFEDWLAARPDQAARDRAGAALVELYLGPLFREGLYDCDPHPGNYLFGEDGRIAFVDFGCAAELDGARAAAARALVRAFFAPTRPRLSRLWRDHAGALGGELVFLLRTLVGISAVLRRIGARVDWERIVEPPVAANAADAATEPRATEPLPMEPIATAPPPTEPIATAPPPTEPIATAPPPTEPSLEEPSPVEPSATEPPPTVEPPLPTVDTSVYDLVLDHPGVHLIAVIRQLRDVTGLDLRDVKLLVDDCPRTIASGLPRADAKALRARLESAGARVSLRRTASRNQ